MVVNLKNTLDPQVLFDAMIADMPSLATGVKPPVLLIFSRLLTQRRLGFSVEDALANLEATGVNLTVINGAIKLVSRHVEESVAAKLATELSDLTERTISPKTLDLLGAVVSEHQEQDVEFGIPRDMEALLDKWFEFCAGLITDTWKAKMEAGEPVKVKPSGIQAWRAVAEQVAYRIKYLPDEPNPVSEEIPAAQPGWKTKSVFAENAQAVQDINKALEMFFRYKETIKVPQKTLDALAGNTWPKERIETLCHNARTLIAQQKTQTQVIKELATADQSRFAGPIESVFNMRDLIDEAKAFLGDRFK